MKIAAALSLALVAASILGAAPVAFAQERNVDPETLPPQDRAFALYGPIGDRDPTGRPADPGCTWSRLQIPTAQGLRWVDHESCDPDMMR